MNKNSNPIFNNKQNDGISLIYLSTTDLKNGMLDTYIYLSSQVHSLIFIKTNKQKARDG